MEFSSRQENIIQTAMRIIESEGIEELTTKNLAKQVGVTEAALYRHFESKTGILLGVLQYFEGMVKAQLERVGKLPLSPLAKIGTVLRERSRDFQENPALTVVILSEEIFPNSRELAEKISETVKLNRDFFVLQLGEALIGGEILPTLDPEQAFRLIIGPFRLLVTQWRLSRQGFSLPDEFEKFWKELEKVLKPK